MNLCCAWFALGSFVCVSFVLRKQIHFTHTSFVCLFDLSFSLVRDLYPYQMKLASMDNMRVDGKFLDKDKEIPEGQGICNSLLSECYDILYELQDSVIEESSDVESVDEDIEVELRGSRGLDVVV